VKGLNKEQRKLLFIFIFLIRFLILVIPLYLIIFFGNLSTLAVLEARQVSFFLNLSKTKSFVEMKDNIVILNVENMRNKLIIDDACTGYRSILAFIALVLAVPKVENKKRFYALIIGLPLIYVINIFRIYSTILIALKFGEEKLEFVHTFLWREGLILLILILWIFWLKKINLRLST
jgi:exosortase/archaeosortase family protein